jgi:hypothetical protein
MDRLVFHASVPFESYISRADIAICGERFLHVSLGGFTL